MNLLRTLLSRIAALFRSRSLDADLDEELSAHIEFAVEENLKRGMSTQAARTQALRDFGGVTQTAEAYRMQRGVPFAESLLQDGRYALRQLRRKPSFHCRCNRHARAVYRSQHCHLFDRQRSNAQEPSLS